jgi:hypothetical protein
MPSANATFTEMVTTTLRNHATAVTDNITNNNALLATMKKRGNIVTKSGGYEIAQPISYDENKTYQRFSGLDTLNINQSEVLSAAKYDWMQAAIHVIASGRELRMNAGKEQMIDLVAERIEAAIATAANNLSIDLYSDGSLTNQIGGLAHIIQTNGQGTVGGINSATYTTWRNQFREITGSNTWTKATIRGEMNQLFLSCTIGADKPDLLVASHDFYSAYEESLQDQQRYADANSAAAGFETLRYKSASIIFDSNTNFGTTAERMYFLNTKYLKLVQHKDAQWTEDDEKKPINQDGVVIPMYWMGNLICGSRRRQGILIDAV